MCHFIAYMQLFFIFLGSNSSWISPKCVGFGFRQQGLYSQVIWHFQTFSQKGISSYSGRETIVNLCYNCLDICGTTDLHGLSCNGSEFMLEAVHVGLLVQICQRGKWDIWNALNLRINSTCAPSGLQCAKEILKWRNFHSKKRIKSFPFTQRRKNCKTHQSLASLDLCLRKTRARKSHDFCQIIIFKQLRFQNVFRPHEKGKPALTNLFRLKSVFEKLRFCDGLVWTVEKNLCF